MTEGIAVNANSNQLSRRKPRPQTGSSKLSSACEECPNCLSNVFKSYAKVLAIAAQLKKLVVLLVAKKFVTTFELLVPNFPVPKWQKNFPVPKWTRTKGGRLK